MSFGIKDLRKGMYIGCNNNNYTADVGKKFLINSIDIREGKIYVKGDRSIFYFEPFEIDWELTAKLNGIVLQRKELEQFLEDGRPSFKEANEGMERVFAQGDNPEKQYNPKYDQGKLDWTLLPINEIEEVVKVLDYGKNKYSVNAWQGVENAEIRYLSATYRHLVEYQKGNKVDEESGLSHLSHLATNVLFLMWFNNNKGE